MKPQKRFSYNIDNMEMLINEVRKSLKLTPAKVRTETQYGQPYEERMKVNSVNGKTGWTIDKDFYVSRLTSI